MYGVVPPILGTLDHQGRPTASGNTAFTYLVPPFMGGPGRQRGIQQLGSTAIPPARGGGIIHVEKVIYTTQGTAHLIQFMRPLNYTTFAAAVAAAGTAITLTADPGLYSTNYKYDSVLGTGTAAVADHAIAAGDYCAYQLVDGTWQADTIASGTFGGGNLVLSTGAPSVTGGGIAKGSPFYYFGLATLKDPATGAVGPQTTIALSQTRDATWASAGYGICATLHEGDPLLFYSPNTTNQGWLEGLFGYYAKF